MPPVEGVELARESACAAVGSRCAISTSPVLRTATIHSEGSFSCHLLLPLRQTHRAISTKAPRTLLGNGAVVWSNPFSTNARFDACVLRPHPRTQPRERRCRA